MSETPHYSMVIQWSDEDHAYLVTLPEWADQVLGPVTDGDSSAAVKPSTRSSPRHASTANRCRSPVPARVSKLALFDMVPERRYAELRQYCIASRIVPHCPVPAGSDGRDALDGLDNQNGRPVVGELRRCCS